MHSIERLLLLIMCGSNPFEVVHPGWCCMWTRSHFSGTQACHCKLGRLDNLGIGLFGIVCHENVISLSRFERVARFYHKGWIIDRECELLRLHEYVLEGDADAQSGLDDVRTLWLWCKAVAVEGDDVIATCGRRDGERGVSIAEMRRFKGDIYGGLCSAAAC